jgi:hypothetical protein
MSVSLSVASTRFVDDRHETMRVCPQIVRCMSGNPGIVSRAVFDTIGHKKPGSPAPGSSAWRPIQRRAVLRKRYDVLLHVIA